MVLPWLVYLAVRRGRPALLRFIGGGALVFLVFWGPVLALRFDEFRDVRSRLPRGGTPGVGFAYFVTAAGTVLGIRG